MSKPKQVAGTSQWRKLLFSKMQSDQYGYVWRVSPLKGLFWLIAILLILIMAYSFFVPNQQGYLQNALFYAIITVVIVIIMWLAGNFIWKGRKIFVGFILAWILILGFYWVMGVVFGFFKLMTFNYGMSTWIAITALAIVGATRINGELDKNDVFYGLLVFIILVVGNLPIFASGGFFAELDKFLKIVTDVLSKGINLGNLLPK